MKSKAFYAMLVLGLCCVMYIMSFFHRVCPAVLAFDLSSDLGISPADVGFFSSATMLAYGLMQLPSGLLADAFGGKKTMVGLSLLAALGTLGFAFGSSYGVMVISRFAVGIGLAVTVPALALLALWFPAQRYGRASSILLCCGGLGGILAAPPLVLLSDAFGWRPAIAVFGFLTLGMALLTALFIPGTGKGEQSIPSAPKSKRRTDFRAIGRGIKLVMRTPSFWPLALWEMCMAGTYFAMASLWWGPYLMEACGLSKMEAGFVLTGVSLTLLITQPLMGCLSDTVFKARKMPVMLCSGLGVCASAFMVVGGGQMSLPLVLFQNVCLMIGLTTGAPLVFTMTKEIFPVHMAGTATGCMNMFYPIWAVVVQKLYGLVLALNSSAEPRQAYAYASIVILANCLLGLTSCFFMKETYNLAEEPEILTENLHVEPHH